MDAQIQQLLLLKTIQSATDSILSLIECKRNIVTRLTEFAVCMDERHNLTELKAVAEAMNALLQAESLAAQTMASHPFLTNAATYKRDS